MIKIFAKNTDYNGISAGIQFKNGVAEISHSDLKESSKEYFESRGYKIDGLTQDASEINAIKTIKKAKK